MTCDTITSEVDVGAARLYITRHTDRTRIAITWRDDHATHSIDMSIQEARNVCDSFGVLLAGAK